jgi:transposase-like protein
MTAKKKTDAPSTLLEAVRYFADEDVALAFLANVRWPSGEQQCPNCGTEAEHYYLSSQKRWKCRECRKQFSIKVGTIFEDSPIKLSQWLPAVWMLVNCKNGISSHELARALGVTQKTAWFMLHRIRLAMQEGTFNKMNGDVEVDETYIGGKARNMHASKRKRVVTGRGRGSGKVAVLGLLERNAPDRDHSTVRLQRLWDVDTAPLPEMVRQHVEAGSAVYTDAFKPYRGLRSDYVHKVIDHAECYAIDNVHTNGLENFWSLLKRAVKGTYVAVEPFHLFRYLDEQAFRFNNRKDNDGGRFIGVLRSIINKRLTYSELTGAELAPS